MANDVFALSPISANGTLPSEADYNAISEAFMETARGRWFLKEYARRNRNADTAVVLEAVGRIEASIAAQKRQGPVTGLAGAMSVIQEIVDHAKTEASSAIEQLTSDETFAPSRTGVRVIREVAWRLREIGYDGRICDILETQASAIAANHDAPGTQQAHAALLASFDDIARQIAKLVDNDLAASPSAENVVSLTVKPQPQPSSSTRISTPDPVKMAEPEAVIEQTPVEVTAEPAKAASMIAVSEYPALGVAIIGDKDQEAASSTRPRLTEASLGEALLARGMVTVPGETRNSPLAPIRRMSQAEKIAFFS